MGTLVSVSMPTPTFGDTMLQDPIAAQIQQYIGRNLRLQIGELRYVGKIISATDETVELVSGQDNPVSVCLRTEAIDSVMVYIDSKD